MMTKDEAIHKALKVLNCLNNNRVYETAWVKGAINACKEALKQSVQSEYMVNEGGTGTILRKLASSWQGLTDDEIEEIYDELFISSFGLDEDDIKFARAIEQALRNKNATNY